MDSQSNDNVIEEGNAKKAASRRGLVTAAKVFIIIGIVLNACIALSEFIALLRLWTTDYFVFYGLIFDVCVAGIVFGVKALDQMSSGKPSNITCVGVLLFANMIGGILLLCTEREDYRKKAEVKNPVQRKRIAPAIRIHIIIGFVLNLLCGALAMSQINYFGREYIFHNDPKFSYFYPSLNYLTFADYLFFFCFIVWFIWCVAGIVSGILALVKMSKGKPSKIISVLAITNNIIAGILLLCSKEVDFQKQEVEQANTKGGLVAVAKAYISVGIAIEGLIINVLLVFFIALVAYSGILFSTGFWLTEEWVEPLMGGTVLMEGIANYISYSLFGSAEVTYGAMISLICGYAVIMLAFCGAGIACGIKALNKMAEGKYSTSIAVCMLIFTNIIGGILWICADKTEDTEITENIQKVYNPQTADSMLVAEAESK